MSTPGPDTSSGTDGYSSIPAAAVARLPVYRRVLLELLSTRVSTVSSTRLAILAGVNAAKVRKDLSYLGSFGIRGVGYNVEHLLYEVSRELGLTHDWPVVIAGLGNLGSALANYGGFLDRGFPVRALVDTDPAKVGSIITGVPVRHLDDLEEIVRQHRIAIGIVATPAAAAQDVVDRMAAAGIGSILNFAPVVVTTTPDTNLRNVDLSVELQVLSFYQRRHAPGDREVSSAPAAPAGGGLLAGR